MSMSHLNLPSARESYINIAYTVKSCFSRSTQAIAILYLIAITVFFFIGGVFLPR